MKLNFVNKVGKIGEADEWKYSFKFQKKCNHITVWVQKIDRHNSSKILKVYEW